MQKSFLLGVLLTSLSAISLGSNQNEQTTNTNQSLAPKPKFRTSPYDVLTARPESVFGITNTSPDRTLTSPFSRHTPGEQRALNDSPLNESFNNNEIFPGYSISPIKGQSGRASRKEIQPLVAICLWPSPAEMLKKLKDNPASPFSEENIAKLQEQVDERTRQTAEETIRATVEKENALLDEDALEKRRNVITNNGEPICPRTGRRFNPKAPHLLEALRPLEIEWVSEKTTK